MMDISWGDAPAWGAFFLATALAVERAIRWRNERKFVSVETFYNNEKIRNDEQIAQDEEIVRAHHRLDLLAKDIAGLPGYEHFNNLGKSLNGVIMEQAVGNEKLETIKSDISLIRKDLEKLTENRYRGEGR